jgi:hypothetical protein
MTSPLPASSEPVQASADAQPTVATSAAQFRVIEYLSRVGARQAIQL